MFVYHSPEVSKSDKENPSNNRKIIAKNLKWRSTTKEQIKPFLALNRTVSGYKRFLKNAVQNAYDKQLSNMLP
ncbi:4553_t:CDS:2 [Racocetra fulgida]|uniref:4553_t:CDS:1 n=1 Tax=Racocetra fulgida TaxID=60492 RepID=A0A9N8YV45_9GLOM|nr:4553_t:CDS:2 [Racocetra fulgida]